MDKLILKKDGSIVSIQWNSETQEDEITSLEDEVTEFYNLYKKMFPKGKEHAARKVLIGKFNELIELEKGFTLRSYFDLVTKYEQLQDIYIWFPFFITESQNAPKEGCICEPGKEPDVEYLEIQQNISYTTYEDRTEWAKNFVPTETTPEEKARGLHNMDEPDGLSHMWAKEILKKVKTATYYPGDPDIECYWNFHGIGVDPDNKDQQIGYAIEHSPLAHLLDLEIKIGNTNLCVYKEDGKIQNAKQYDVSGTPPTLYEFVNGVIWELSFCGIPDMRNEQLKELLSRCDEIKERTQELDMEKD